MQHRSLRSAEDMARETQTSLGSPSFHQYEHHPLPAISSWTHLSTSSNATEAIHMLCYQQSPPSLPHSPPLFFKITFSLLLYIVFSWTAQVFIFQTWRWIHLWLSAPHHCEGQLKMTTFSFAIISLSEKKRKHCKRLLHFHMITLCLL